MVDAALYGFAVGLSLIVAIGAQNAFVLRQGLLRSHVLPLCIVCALSDALLILLGVAGFGSLVARSAQLLGVVTLGGALFLLAYAALALRRAVHPHALAAAGDGDASLRRVLVTGLAFTFLNPHVYLDTVVLVGGLSAQFAGTERWAYAFGAMTASFLWFFSLGYGAALLTPVFARPAAWRVLDLAIAMVMTALGVNLLVRFFGSTSGAG